MYKQEHGKVDHRIWFIDQHMTVIIDDQVFNFYLDGEYDKPKSLDMIAEENPDCNTILVIAECGLHGEIYRYGNHGQYWEYIGDTVGYA